MAASSNTPEETKYGPRNAFEGLRIVLPAPAASGQQVYPRISVFDGLIIAPPTPASTSSASSSGMKHLPYDVFINHHGGDVKHMVANGIYNSLVATGLRVFLDKDELALGDFFPIALEEAMASASIHIAIFSDHYAQSPGCLAELAFMLQTGTPIFPIFYHVEPSDLRWAVGGKGIYADAFSMYERKGRYTPEVVKRWKLALHEASFYAGQIIRKQDDEQKVVKNVVNRVLTGLKVQLDVDKHQVGLDETVQDFGEFALQYAGPIQIVGIWGMGGVGKTTLAKELYKKKCSTVDRSSFLFDVREAARKELLHEKQKKLLEDFGLKGRVADFDNVEGGKEILKCHLTSVSTLMVLDDVDHRDQLDALLPARESLGHGSLIIVTTRELRVLEAWGVSIVYKMRPLNLVHAEQLFCWHAFRRPSPLLGFESFTKKVIKACHGLPLSLKVLGGQLYGEYSLNYWHSILEKLTRIVPEDIKLRLKISYDALDKEEKEMFLDIACFFIGCRSSCVIAVWDGSEWNGLHGWQRLVNKCLVELDENNLIKMHDHLKDLGREIANQQSPYRLWSPQQIIKIHPQQEAIRIRGIVEAIGDNCYPQQGKIIIHTSQGERSLAPRSLGLKIFVGNGDFLRLEHSELSTELVWLQCNQFEHKNLPSWLSLKKLRILELFDLCSLEDLWERDVDAPLQLRELVIQRCSSLRGFPRSITHLKNLRKILIGQDYVNCDTLSSLPQEFCHLQSLEHLEIKWCRNLSSLPSNFGELTNLQHLNLNGCTKLKVLPNSFEKLILLEYLNLQGCGELIIKSCILENMTKLRYLNLDGCRKLEDLRLPEVASLTELYLKGTSLKELPANIFQQTKLTELVIGSEFLTTLPISLGNLSFLTRLGIQGCKELESLPNSLGNLSSLTRLAIQGCKELKYLPDSLEHLNFLGHLDIKQSGVKLLPKSFIHLQSLNIDDTPITELSFGSGCMLKSINLHHTKVSKISISGDSCPFLETLSLIFNEDLWYLETLPATLKRIVVSDCNVLQHIRGVRGLRNLQTLEIKNCEELDGLPCLTELVSLEIFTLQGSGKVKKISGLQESRSLRELRIELIELPSLAELTSLKKIELQNCHNLEKIESLKHLKSLDELKISDCLGLKALPSLKEITSLKEFQLITCHKLEKIEDLENLKSLETLRIYDCPELDGLPCLTELTSLKKLYLQMYDKLEKVEGLERLRSLETLKISDCPELDGLPSLAELTSLKEFDLRMCHKLKKIEGLEQLRSLEKLEVHTRWQAPCIVSLEQCERLKSLVVVADDRSAIEPFISNRKKWPREVITCTRAVFDVGSLKNYFELPNVSVLDFDRLQTGFLELRRPESSANANAILICLIIDCNDPDLDFYVRPGIDNLFDPDYFNTELGKGKWVWMGVFTQGSEWLLSNLGIGFLCVFKEDKVKFEVEQAWLVMGEEGSIVEAFNQLFQSDKQRAVKEMNKVPLEIANHPVGLDEAVEEFYIKRRLKISYDELDEEEKQMFLDTACFFIGEENSLAIAVWDGSEWSGLRGWESLFNKQLVYLDENNRITMHDHLRDLGRELADQQSPYRLWSSWQLNQIQPQQEHIKIRGMINATGADCYSLQGMILIDRNEVSRSLVSSSLGLKLLVGSGEFRNQEVGELSRELLWLRWDDFNHTNLPPWLSLKNLRVLELNGALNLQELWTDDAHAPLQLRELIITGTWSASFERFPRSISYLKHLKKIALLGYVCQEFGIKELPEEFCDLQSLEHLELRHCKLLSTLPTRFGELRKLRHLDLFSCEMLRKLPYSFKQLVNLKYLDLSGCKKLSPMPDILENMRELENLYFSGCPKLQELPLQIAEKKNLRELHLKKTMLMDVPDNIDQLSKLETLVIGSTHLTGFPESLGNLSSLTRLKITRCIKLESLPESVERLKLLEYLCIKSSGVRSLPEGFRQLTNLQNLKIFDCPIAELDFGSGSSSSLGKLKAIHLKATDVTRLSISQNCCPNLETLQLELNRRLMEIDILSSSVKTVKVYDCKMLRNLNGIPGLVRPETFEMTGCPKLGPNITAATRSAVSTYFTERFSFSKEMRSSLLLEELEALENLAIVSFAGRTGSPGKLRANASPRRPRFPP